MTNTWSPRQQRSLNEYCTKESMYFVVWSVDAKRHLKIVQVLFWLANEQFSSFSYSLFLLSMFFPDFNRVYFSFRSLLFSLLIWIHSPSPHAVLVDACLLFAIPAHNCRFNKMENKLLVFACKLKKWKYYHDSIFHRCLLCSFYFLLFLSLIFCLSFGAEHYYHRTVDKTMWPREYFFKIFTHESDCCFVFES